MNNDYPDTPLNDSYERIPPHSLEAEQSVLGSLLLDSASWEEANRLIVDSDFYRHEHRLIYRAMTALSQNNQPIDVITVAERLEESADIEKVGGREYLSYLSHTIPSAENCAAYADIVRSRAQQRQLIQAASDIIGRSYEPQGTDTLTLISDAEASIAKIAEGRNKEGEALPIKQILGSTIKQMKELHGREDGLSGITSGFRDIDERTSGWQKADLIIVAARPSMGKTTYAMNLIENALMATNRPCVVFSLEMPAESLAMRMLSSLCKIDQSKVRSGKLNATEWKELSGTAKMFSEKPLYIDDTAGLTPPEMRARTRQVYRKHNDIGLVMVDYLQLMRVSGTSEGRTHEISEISRSLKALAKEFNCPVIALSQLNRSLEQRPNKRPIMSDLRESGAIEQDADIIQFIYRDEVYNEDSDHKGVAEIITGKHRNGPIGVDRLAFEGKYTRFKDLGQDNNYAIDQDE